MIEGEFLLADNVEVTGIAHDLMGKETVYEDSSPDKYFIIVV